MILLIIVSDSQGLQLLEGFVESVCLRYITFQVESAVCGCAPVLCVSELSFCLDLVRYQSVLTLCWIFD